MRLPIAVLAVTLLSPGVAPKKEFVVHEWGTFTGMQGSGGEALEGLQHEVGPLPSFVHSRTEAVRSPFLAFGDSSWEERLPEPAPTPTPAITRAIEGVRSWLTGPPPPRHKPGEKMETPVLYFYGGAGTHMRVHVDYLGGLLTQWYPAADAQPAAPALDDSLRSSLDWSVDLVDPSANPALPRVAADDPWGFAREVGADFVRTSGGETERYLFYRGLGWGMSQRMSLLATRGGRTSVTSHAAEPIPAAFALEVDGDRARFARIGPVAAWATREVVMPAAMRTLPETSAALRAAMSDALVAEGLFRDEAEAMVKTWSATWFEAQGTRVLYLLPRAETDAVIPLEIEPKPDRLVRVLVGRLEYLTPEAEDAIEGDLRDRAIGDPAAREAAMRRLAARGRFLEPALMDVRRKSVDPDVLAGASELLDRMR